MTRRGPPPRDVEARDVVVVGGGPAGSSAALTLARAGVDVLLVDRATLPRWKVCGGCLGPPAIVLLRGLGLLDAVRDAGAVSIDVMQLRAGRRRARLRLPGSLSLSRYRLDALLCDAVVDAGGDVCFGVRVERLATEDEGVELRVRFEGEVRRLRARVVVDATGLGGLQLRGARSAEDVAEGSRVGLGAVFPPDVVPPHDRSGGRGCSICDPGELHMMVGRYGYVGMVRTESGALDVAAAVDRSSVSRLGPAGAVAAIVREAGSRLPETEPVFGWRGTPALTRRTPRAAEGNVFRVGDAAGYVEPFTGEGMGWALAGGVSVAPLVLEALDGAGEEAARRWIRTHRRVVERRQRVCRFLALGLRRPVLVGAAVRALRVAPVLARPLMAATARLPHLDDAARWPGEPATGASPEIPVGAGVAP